MDKKQQNRKGRRRMSFEPQIPLQIESKHEISKLKSLKVISADYKDNLILNTAFMKEYPDYPEVKISPKCLGQVKSYAYNSYRGINKPKNEDRVVVINQIPKPTKTMHKIWPKMHFFGIFDGHGGDNISEFLKKNFLSYLNENKNFPYDIKLALSETFEKIEADIYEQNKGKTLKEIDRSGSCALVAVLTESKIYIANIGDSRAIMSLNYGSKIKQLTVDHKPNNITEYERIIKNGGKVYVDDDYLEDLNGKYDANKLKYILKKTDFDKYKGDKEAIFRHYPSNLAIARSIGDLKAKKKEYGGIPGNIIGIPDIYVLDYSTSNDFMIMGCDGIFDYLSNEELAQSAWYIIKKNMKDKNYSINLLTRDSCDMIIKYSMDSLATDNLTCIVIGLDGLQKYINLKKIKEKK